ncbi:putative endopolygalacturonase A [Aspergillus sclerotiicarbonarius CBS 121057]|uniref:endo-polygalacturonase n=1 Tax=Aspergillus sclerotiicarbonarius (strain CBS 121057 / IBT 28362) TaxID=1448318 RepID=A0A319DVS8_ASPSB|nr:putative endopolygalacturonase A [Aspergillus sclerotiicarbonarius CBS 121057]
MPSVQPLICLATLAGAALVSAAPAPSRASEFAKRSSCTFTDAATASESKKSCSSIVLKDITVPAGETLNLKDLEDGTTVTFEGTTTWEYEEWSGPLLYISGKDITVTQESGAVLDGNGAKWWDGEGTNGGKTKPKFFYAHDLDDSKISGLQIKNTPVQAISVEADNLIIEDVTIDNSDGDSEGGHNTDGFDISESTYITITGATVKNQDDCVAINSGENIYFSGGTCSGGHGLSIGSVGGRDDNTVKNVTFIDSTVSDSENGVRIKTVYDATGTVEDITFSNIQISGISDYGIVIEQDYENGDPTGTPSNGITISDVKLEEITGSVDSDAVEIYILCGDGSCTDWTMSGIDITGGETSSKCENLPSGASCSQ